MSVSRLALAFMIASALMIPVGDAFAKELSRVTTMEPQLVAWARLLTGAAVFAPLAVLRANGFRPTRRFMMAQILRGACGAGGIFCMVTAVSHAPLADVFGAFFIAPAIATFLAATLLRERVTRLDLASLILGLIGVAMVTRPGATMNVGLLWALGGGVSYGVFNAATRWSAPFGPPLAHTAGQMVVGAAILTPFAIEGAGAAIEAPGLLLCSGLASAFANFCLVMAYARERAAVLSPLIYLQLPSAALIGWAAFGDLPDRLAIAGLALIVVAGLGLRLWANVREGRRSARPPSPR